MSEVLEIQQVVEHLQGVLENLITRGLRSAGLAERNALATLGEELTRIGAGHLAERVMDLRDALEKDDADGPSRLFKTQASLRLFERVLTLEVARGTLMQWGQPAATATEVEDDADDSESD
jgi:hypothetical protein